MVEDHFARLNKVLTGGNPIVNIGVIHPIESYWLLYGPDSQTKITRDRYDKQFTDFADWMLYDTADFDYISESLLPGLCNPEDIGKRFPVGRMNYKVIIVPDLITIRSSTLERLERFHKNGGHIIFMGNVPEYVDGTKSDEVLIFSEHCEHIPFEHMSLRAAVDRYSEIKLYNKKMGRTINLLASLNEDGENRWLFVSHVNRKFNGMDKPDVGSIVFSGQWIPYLYDTATGKSKEYYVYYDEAGNTVMPMKLYGEDSLLLYLKKGKRVQAYLPKAEIINKSLKLNEPEQIEFSEPNVFLLDYASVKLDDGPWSEKMDILSADDMLREQLGLPRWKEKFVQPYRVTEPDNPPMVSMKMSFESTVDVDNVMLALEKPEITQIIYDGKELSGKSIGYFTDYSIKTIMLGTLTKGIHEIVLTLPFTIKNSLEWCYLLGDFGVNVIGEHKAITKVPEKLYYGNLCIQSYPFYTGNYTYSIKKELEEDMENVYISIPEMAACVCSVRVNGKEIGDIAFCPHKLYLGKLKAGENVFEITVFGNRFNSFGTVHNTNYEMRDYSAPNAYRAKGSNWSDAYQLNENGILSAPFLEAFKLKL